VTRRLERVELAGERRRRWPRVLGWLLGVLVLGVLAGVTWWLVTAPDAEVAPLAAVRSDPALRVTEDGGVWTLAPASGQGDTAVVFYPGGGVPPEAYLANWAPIVSETGITVHVPSMPLRLAVLRPGSAAAVIDAHPEVSNWWVGGHSLGGAMAASFAGGTQPGELAGLVLWASYATAGAELSDRDDLVVVSVSGSEDGLSTPDDITERTPLLPSDTTFTELDGVTHAQFGAYGPQSGDGNPGVTGQQARRAIADATAAVLAPG
jgi:hypothetical protein